MPQSLNKLKKEFKKSEFFNNNNQQFVIFHTDYLTTYLSVNNLEAPFSNYLKAINLQLNNVTYLDTLVIYLPFIFKEVPVYLWK